MKKTIIIPLALLMVMSLAACGGGSASTNTPAATEAPSTPEPTPEPTLNPIETNDDLLGTWVCSYVYTSNSYPKHTNHELLEELELYEHGYGKWRIIDPNYKEDDMFYLFASSPITWKITEDELLEIEGNMNVGTTAFIIADNDGKIGLSKIDGSKLFQKSE